MVQTFLPPPGGPAIDLKTGRLTAEWYRYFNDERRRTGGNADALEEISFDQSGTVAQLEARINDLESQLQEMLSADSERSERDVEDAEAFRAEQFISPEQVQELLGTATTWTPAGNGVSLTVTYSKYGTLGPFTVALFDLTWPVTADTNLATVSGLPKVSSAAYLAQTGGVVVSLAAASSSFTVSTYNGTAYTNAELSGERLSGVLVYA